MNKNCPCTGLNVLVEQNINRKYKLFLSMTKTKLELLIVQNSFMGCQVSGEEIVINYCPFCGRKLVEETEGASQ